MSEHPVDSADSIEEQAHDGVDDTPHEVFEQEEPPRAAEEARGSCLEAIISNIVGITLLIIIILIAHSRFSYVSIRFLDDSENLEATVYRWWGLKEEVFPLKLHDVSGTPRWMYGDVKGRLESINYDDRFTSPFIIRLPWKKDLPEDSRITDTTVDGLEASEPAP